MKHRAKLVDGINDLTDGLVGVLTDLERHFGIELEALRNDDFPVLQQLIIDDVHFDRRIQHLTDTALMLIATQQPVATDLRRVGASLAQYRATERIGDQIGNIGKLALAAADGSGLPDSINNGLQTMGECAREQLVQARQAIQLWDANVALQLRDADTRINVLQREVFQDAVEAGAESHQIQSSMQGVLMARAIERIGDLSVYIGDQTVYAITGSTVGPRDPWTID